MFIFIELRLVQICCKILVMIVLSELIVKDKLMPSCYSVKIIIFEIKTHFLFSETIVRIMKSFDIYYVGHGRVKESA